jgi:hypothetical protein
MKSTETQYPWIRNIVFSAPARVTMKLWLGFGGIAGLGFIIRTGFYLALGSFLCFGVQSNKSFSRPLGEVSLGEIVSDSGLFLGRLVVPICYFKMFFSKERTERETLHVLWFRVGGTAIFISLIAYGIFQSRP